MKQIFQFFRGVGGAGHPSVWRYRDLRIAAPARALSVLGDELALVALMLRVHDSGAGAGGITMLLVAAALPTVLLIPWSGRLSDELDSRLLTVASGLGQAGVCAALAWAPSGWPTYGLVVALQAGNAVSRPAWSALVPRISGEADVGRAVAASQALMTLAGVAGPALGGLLTGWGGARLALLTDAATFVGLAIAGAAVRARRGGRLRGPDRPHALDGLRILRRDPVLWPMLVTLLAYVLVGETTNVAEVFLVRDTLHATATQFGLVGTVIGAGIFVGSVVGGRARGTRQLVCAVVASAISQAAILAAAGLAPTMLTFAVAWALLGLANGVLSTTWMTLTMTRVPDASRGQAVAAVSGLSRACSVGALGLGGLAVSDLGARGVFVCSGFLALLVSGWLARRVHTGISPSRRAMQANRPAAPGELSLQNPDAAPARTRR